MSIDYLHLSSPKLPLLCSVLLLPPLVRFGFEQHAQVFFLFLLFVSVIFLNPISKVVMMADWPSVRPSVLRRELPSVFTFQPFMSFSGLHSMNCNFPPFSFAFFLNHNFFFMMFFISQCVRGLNCACLFQGVFSGGPGGGASIFTGFFQ